MFSLNATDVMQAKAAAADKVNWFFDGVTIAADGAESFGGLPLGQLGGAVAPIWAATIGEHVLRLIFKNTDVADQAVELYKNGADVAHMLVAFVIPAGGGAVFSGGSLKVWASNGVPAT